MRNLLLTLLLSLNCFALDYSLQTSGPHHVVQGHYLFFQLTGVVTTGPDENATPTVSGLPFGAIATFPNMIKFCCTDHLWTINGSTPVQINTTAATPVGTYALTITYTSVSGVVRSVIHSLVIDPVPVPIAPVTFPADVPLASQVQWEANMIKFGKMWCTTPAGGPAYEGNPWYYDGERVYWQVSDYTKDTSYNKCATDLDALYASYVLTNNGTQGYHVFPVGLAMNFLRTGNVQAKAALLLLLDKGYANYQNLTPQDSDALTSWLMSRELAYAGDTHFAALSIGNPPHPNFQNVIELIFGHFEQWKYKTAAYVQPFMVALSSEPLINYYAATKDPRVIPVLKSMADQLWNDSWDATSQGFLYYNYNAADGPPPPLPYPYDPQCPNKESFKVKCQGPSTDLNLLLAPLFGWVYQQTGLKVYRDRGDQIFNSGVVNAWLFGGKQFSQNYRWSDKYLEWRKAPKAPLQTFQFKSCSKFSVVYSLCINP